MGVTKGRIIRAIHDEGVNTLSQLKETTRASTGCGSCTKLCCDLLRAGRARSSRKRRSACSAPVCPSPKTNCATSSGASGCAASRNPRHLRQRQGCEVCKPALSYMLDMLWCGDHDEDRSARYINDRVHANIQKDGTFSVIPRIRGGVTNPAELRRIADVAEKYHVPM